jgi:hypothetical protein
MSNDYYYARAGKQFGPITPADLKMMASRGDLTQDDLVWKEGMSDWVLASKIKGLFTESPKSTANIPPTLPLASVGKDNPTATNSSMGRNELRQQSEAEARAKEIGKQAKDAAVSVSLDAWKAFKSMAVNPVGGLRVAFDNLGANRAMTVGIVFGILFDLCIVGGIYIFVRSDVSPIGRMSDIPSGMIIKMVLLGLVPLLSATAGFSIARKLLKCQGSIHSDIFVAGASLLPFGIAVLAAGFIGIGNIEVIAVLAVFALTTTILMMYSGCTTIQCIPDAAATFCVPLMLVGDLYLSKVLLVWILGTP